MVAATGPYWYWTTLGPHNVNLTDSEATLPPGNYNLFWDFRGPAGSKFAFEVIGPAGALVEVSDTIPANSVDGWGTKSFVVP
jgi:hypothetical protein